MDGEWKRLARSGGDLAFVMLDVDHFKEYNDTLGHPAGDECLRRLAEALRPLAQRPGDLVARYGGEEFACLLLGLDRDQASAHAERLRAAVEGLALPHPGSGVSPFVTVSLGVAWARPVPSGEWRDALAAADAALYRAKQGGRNRVACSVRSFATYFAGSQYITWLSLSWSSPGSPGRRRFSGCRRGSTTSCSRSGLLVGVAPLQILATVSGSVRRAWW